VEGRFQRQISALAPWMIRDLPQEALKLPATKNMKEQKKENHHTRPIIMNQIGFRFDF
jgi:hypothetical protein